MPSRNAFTLIELLVVISIIAILAAILFPVFAQAKMAAKKAVSLSNMKQVGLSTMLYQNDNDDITVPLRWYDPAQATGEFASAQGFFHYPLLLLPYTKSTEIFLDAADRDDDPAMHFSTCPAAGRFDKAGCAYYYLQSAYPSYGYNRQYLNDFTIDPTLFVRQYRGKSGTAFASPAETLLFAEATGKDIISPGQPIVRTPVGYHRVDPPSLWLSLANASPQAIGLDARTQGQLWGRYDPKSVIVTWLDGHAKVTPIDRLKGVAGSTESRDRYFNGVGTASP
ncbi:MAG: hypothetical protein C4320_01985 [Armatimonadota bacterium]